MVDIPLAGSTYKRQVAKEPVIELHNRYAERNPALNDSPVSLISRPGLRKFAEVGTGHIRKVFPAVGSFNDDAFVVSGNDLYRVSSTTGTGTLIGTISSNPLGDISMAMTAPIGTVPAYLFIAEGGVLWYYTDNGHARNTLQFTGAITATETVEIDGVYYEFTAGSVDAGTPDGTLANPWLVDMGASLAISVRNLYYAINANEGTAGTDYSTGTTANTNVEGLAYTGTDLFIQARVAGISGNGITTTETMANAVFNDPTLTDGGTDQLAQVTVPGDLGAISVAHINSFVIVVPVQSETAESIGKFYWIEPGEVKIDPLDFATAERSPDKIHQVLTYGDMFWLFGQKTTEPWITTGDPAAPMQRFQGILFDRGAWEGTAVQVKDSLIVCDEDGGVFMINNGQNRISRPDIEERIRKAIQRQEANPLV